MHICIECYADEVFLKELGFEGANLLHQRGKSEVLKAMEKSKGRVGMVDEDPQSSPSKQWLSMSL